MSAYVILKGEHNADHYHEWVTLNDLVSEEKYGPARISLDKRGYVRTDLPQTNATRWICNNPDCSAQALVRDSAIQRLIDEEEDPEYYRNTTWW